MIEIAVNPGAAHQEQAADALMTGLRRHGHRVEITDRTCNFRGCVIACWGWRKAKAIKSAVPDRPILVIERGYVGDRTVWHSLAFDGLNGNARFPLIDDGGARWCRYFPDVMQPVRDFGEYALLLGQVRNDMSLEHQGRFEQWYQRTFELIKARTDLPVYFRPHPLDLERYGKQALMGLPVIDAPLADALAGAASAWAFNSNSLTDAALAGVPVHPFNQGAMVWPLRGEYLAPSLDPQQRERWAHRLAWCQWTLEEIASGAAWEALQGAKPQTAPVWSTIEGLLHAAA